MRNIVIYSLATAIVSSSSGSVCAARASAWSKSSSRLSSPSFVLAMPRGGASGESYEAKLESAKSRAIEKAYVKVGARLYFPKNENDIIRGIVSSGLPPNDAIYHFLGFSNFAFLSPLPHPFSPFSSLH